MEPKSKPYGIRGELSEPEVFKTHKEKWTKDGIDFLIENSCIEIGFDNPDQEELAREIADNYVLAWSIKNNCSLKIEYNISWEPNSGKRLIKMGLEDKVDLSEHITTVTSDRKMHIVGTSDSISFIENEDLVNKSLSDSILAEALKYYSEEIVGDDNPLYGIYKSIEVIKKSVGTKILAKIAGVNKKYISDVMQTTQIKRHAVHKARRILTDGECKERAKKLILAYAESIK